MGRAPCCQKVGLKRGRWTAEEDRILIKYIQDNGEGSWRSLPKNAGLLRCGKSCRLRWINYLRTDLKRGNITPQEEDLIIKLHATIGKRWSLIASQLSGRTDNEVKNHWNSHLSRSINTWRRPSNDTLPQHIIENLAKLMSKPKPSTKKDSNKNAKRDNNKNPITHEDVNDDNNAKPKTPDALKESVPSNSWSTDDQSLESIFSLENHQDLVEGVNNKNVDIISLNEIVTPALDHLIITPQTDHASNEFQNLDDGVIDIEFMNDLNNLCTSHADIITTMDDDNNTTLKQSLSSTTSLYTFNDPLINMNDWSYWEDYGETLDQDLINHEEVGSLLMPPWLWDIDDVGSCGL